MFYGTFKDFKLQYSSLCLNFISRWFLILKQDTHDQVLVKLFYTYVYFFILFIPCATNCWVKVI